MLLISLAISKTSDGDRGLVVVAQRAVVVLDLEVTDALQHRVHLVEGTFRGLDERDAVLRVALRLGEAADLAAHLLRDGEAGSVVGGAVDAVAAGELLHRLRGLRAGRRELTVRVERLDVVLDTKAHDSTLLVDRGMGEAEATPCRLRPSDRPRAAELEDAKGPGPRSGRPGLVEACGCALLSAAARGRSAGAWLACASMLVPACCRMLSFVNFVISAAMSTSRIRDSDAVRFSW